MVACGNSERRCARSWGTAINYHCRVACGLFSPIHVTKNSHHTYLRCRACESARTPPLATRAHVFSSRTHKILAVAQFSTGVSTHAIVFPVPARSHRPKHSTEYSNAARRFFSPRAFCGGLRVHVKPAVRLLDRAQVPPATTHTNTTRLKSPHQKHYHSPKPLVFTVH